MVVGRVRDSDAGTRPLATRLSLPGNALTGGSACAFGPHGVLLLRELGAACNTIFTYADARRMAGLTKYQAIGLIGRLIAAGWVVKVCRGRFLLAAGPDGGECVERSTQLMLGLALAADPLAYISHGTALRVHQLAPEIEGGAATLLVTTTKGRPAARSLLGAEYRFVPCRAAQVFGVVELEVGQGRRVRVSDPERTIIDTLRRPDLAGGVGPVARVIVEQGTKLDPERLVAYAGRAGGGVIAARLGHLLQSHGGCPADLLDRLSAVLPRTAARLDPSLPAGGVFDARWCLWVNTEEREVAARTDASRGATAVAHRAEAAPETWPRRKLGGLCRRHGIRILSLLDPVPDLLRESRGGDSDEPVVTLWMQRQLEREYRPESRATISQLEVELSRVLDLQVRLYDFAALCRVLRRGLFSGKRVIYHNREIYRRT